MAPRVAPLVEGWRQQYGDTFSIPQGGSGRGGQPFLPGVLPNGRIWVEAAWGADLTGSPDAYPWQDVTADVMNGAKVTITQGRADETSQAQPAQCAFTLLNQGGRYTPYNPMAALYPNVRRGTPIRVRVDIGTGPYVLFQGSMIGATPVWDTSASLATVKIAAAGALRRITQGTTPLRSALYRASTMVAPPIAYWPMEDGSNATYAGSGLPGGIPLRIVSGTAKFAGGGNPGGSAPLIDFSGDLIMKAPVPVSSETSWRVALAGVWAPFSGGDYTAIMQWNTAGDIATWEIDATSLGLGGLYIQAYGANGSFPFLVTSNVTIDDGQWHYVEIAANKSGSDTTFTVYLDGTAVITHTAAGQAFGRVTSVIPGGAPGFSTRWQAGLGHVAVWAPATAAPTNLAWAMTGFDGELATDRILRVCAEENIPCTII